MQSEKPQIKSLETSAELQEPSIEQPVSLTDDSVAEPRLRTEEQRSLSPVAFSKNSGSTNVEPGRGLGPSSSASAFRFRRFAAIVLSPLLLFWRLIGMLIMRVAPFTAEGRTRHILIEANYKSDAHLQTLLGFKVSLFSFAIFCGLLQSENTPVLSFVPIAAFAGVLGWLLPNFFVAREAKRIRSQTAPDINAVLCEEPVVESSTTVNLGNVLLTCASSLFLYLVFPAIFGFGFMVTVIVVAYLSCREQRIKVSKGGIQVTERWFFLNRSTLLRWDELVAVRIEHRKPKRKNTRDLVSLHIADRRLDLDLSKFFSSDRIRLFLALSKYASPEKFSADALFMQMQYLSGGASMAISEPRSVTEIWVNEFSRKFETSNHVPLKPGELVGSRFTVLMQLSMRMNQAVYLAHTKLGERIVLKELVPSADIDETRRKKVLEHFDREASLLSKLNNPRIARVRDHFVDQGRVYIAMDYIAGKNLREYVRKHKNFSEEQVIHIALQVARLLDYLHAQEPPVIHRDVSPDNILYSEEDGSIWLIDFGVASTFTSGATATLVGKQSYMPPEQFRGKAEPASDIYAFGATLFFLLSGQDPRPLGIDSVPETKRTFLKLLVENCTEMESKSRPSWSQIIDALTNCDSQREIGSRS